VTQGGPLSSLIFNVVVDAVVREWLRWTLDNKATRDGLTLAQSATRMVSFYVDDGVLSARDPMWLQSALDVLITLFEQVVLKQI
jgi:retron-type reverse transcriptase